MPVFDPIDGWFEKGFRIRAQKSARSAARTARRDSSRASPSSGGSKFSSGAKTKNAVAVIKRAPECMVKITGSSSGLKTVKSHLDYISRNGEVELIDEKGSTIKGLDEIKALRDSMKASQVPEDGKKREYLHVLFSMPPGTPEKEMKEAVLSFCKEEFANRQWVAALHKDTDHTHVHVCVGTRDLERADEPRLSPRKADLFQWRQGFADKLRENGIDAAASYRGHRFNFRKAENAVVRQIRADNPKSPAFNERRATNKAMTRAMKATKSPEKAFSGPPRPPRTPRVLDAQAKDLKAAMAAKSRPENPAAGAIEKRRGEALAAWEQVARNLDAAGEKDLAKALDSLIREGQKPVSSRNQELYDAAVSSRSKQQGKDEGHSL